MRRTTLVAWGFLTAGIVLGAWWSYAVLGWGGYWGWDPVENASLLPWLTATAFIHSVMVQERRGMLKVWNLFLVISSFVLTMVATFLTRSGFVQSVHAFGSDPVLKWSFLGFICATLILSYGFLVYRLPLLRSRGQLDSWVSREFA
ncbi:MAG TPA: cytochrome c biogenesis protein CcsA, partial [Acidimicrobiia bacterium]|nr:cytochrome c biogenesis protein CcsA [Acidimicrobiia bacterium]